MNEAVGKFCRSLLCLKSLSTQNAFQQLKSPQALKGKKQKMTVCTFLQACVCATTESVRTRLHLQIPQTISVCCHVLCTSAAKAIKEPHLRCQILFSLRHIYSLGCSLFAIHKDGVARQGKWTCLGLRGPSGGGTCEAYINTSSHAVPADPFVAPPRPAERSSRRWLR